MSLSISSSENKKDLAKVFKLFDDDKTGLISIKNIRRIAREIGETMEDNEI